MGRPPDYRTLASLSRIRLLHELQQRGPLTITQLAEATQLHHNTAREHLNRLIAAGFVASDPVPASGRGRPVLGYRTQLSADDLARVKRTRAALENGEIVRRLAGVPSEGERAAECEQLDVLEDHLGRCGIEAHVDGDEEHVALHNCPFAELASGHPEVCDVHFGLLKEALRQTDGPLEAEALHPLESKHRCTLDLGARPVESRAK